MINIPLKILYFKQDKSIIVQNSINKKISDEYAISGTAKDSCEVCGRENKSFSNKACNFHKKIEGVEFKLIFGGYFKTNKNYHPLTPFTERFLRLELAETDQSMNEFVEILKVRYDNYEFNNEFLWATWIPTTNKTMIEISKRFINRIGLLKVEPKKFCTFSLNLSESKKREQYIREKYKPCEINNSLKKILKNSNGIILDDFYHHGTTMARIMEILNLYDINGILGVVITRSNGKKGIKSKFFPK